MSNLSNRFVERFWKYVDRSLDGCWLWTGGKTAKGYGSLRLAGKDSDAIGAHRAAWIIHYGQIPEGMQVCHTCDNKLCVRPDHLFLGTIADNMRDKVSKNRQARGSQNGQNVHPEKRPRGEGHGQAKLTRRNVVEIRARYQPKRGVFTRLAERFGVHRSTIRRVVEHENWKED